ncbi:MAG: threonine--tRNA ligase [Candidatus Thorarchaeota archaeon]
MAKYLIINTKGVEQPLNLDDLDSYEAIKGEFRTFIETEELGRSAKGEPPHIRAMRQLELIDYEPASDVGHFKFYPKGSLLKELLEDYVHYIAVDLIGAMRIDTPLMYRLSQKDIAEQAEKFLEKDYRIKLGKDKELLLRFAGDFGLFSTMKNVQMAQRQLPIRVFELSPSFRLEKRGECVGLRRLRAFTMPDIHCFCADYEQGKEEFARITQFYDQLIKGLGIEYLLVIRIVEEYYKSTQDLLLNLAKDLNRPILVELLPEMAHYWNVKNEFQFVDAAEGSGQLSTVQLDVSDAERYGITYINAAGEEVGTIIVHTSIGSLERLIYGLLESAVKRQNKGKLPMLPLWLSPVQVVVIPVADRHEAFASQVVDQLREEKIRAVLDDRNKTVGWKVRNAGKQWIPFVAVIGDKEMGAKTIPVTIRDESTSKKATTIAMPLEPLIKRIHDASKDKPFRQLSLPKRMSMWPIFI